MNLDEFLSAHDPDGKRVIADVDAVRDGDGNSQFIIVRHGKYAMVLNPLPFNDHLCLDVHPFIEGEGEATAGVFGMSKGGRESLPATGTTSHGWASARLIAVLLGNQGGGMMITDGYSGIIEKVRDAYEPKILGLLNKIRDVLIADSLIAGEPFDMSSDDYAWSMIICRHPELRAPGLRDKDLVDISIEISEERAYDGGSGYGLNFSLTITERGGVELGQLRPYNYTPGVWVDARDPEAVAARWQIMKDADIDDIPDLIISGYEWDEDGYYKKESE